MRLKKTTMLTGNFQKSGKRQRAITEVNAALIPSQKLEILESVVEEKKENENKTTSKPSDMSTVSGNQFSGLAAATEQSNESSEGQRK